MGVFPSRTGKEVLTDRVANKRLFSFLGLAGSESGSPATPFADVLSTLELGVIANPHAGEEADDPDEALANVAAAVDVGAARVGHATIAGSVHPGAAELRQRLRDSDVVVEVIPLMNMAVKSTQWGGPMYPRHPVKALLDDGVRVVLGSDDASCYWPGHPGGAIRENLKHLLHVGVTREQIRSIAADSFVVSTALDAKERRRLIKEVEQWDAQDIENVPLVDNHLHLAGSIPHDHLTRIYDERTASLVAEGRAPVLGLSAGVPRFLDFERDVCGVVTGPKDGDQWENLQDYQQRHYQPLMTISFTAGASCVADHIVSIAKNCREHNVRAATIQAQPVMGTCELFFADQLNIGRVRSASEHDGFCVDFAATIIRNAPVFLAGPLRKFLTDATERACCAQFRWLLRVLCCPSGIAMKSVRLPDQDRVDEHPSRIPPLLSRYDVLLWIFAYGRVEGLYTLPNPAEVPSLVPRVLSKIKEEMQTYRSIAIGITKIPAVFRTKADDHVSGEIESILNRIMACLEKHVEGSLCAAVEVPDAFGSGDGNRACMGCASSS